jgi:SAM-dependent methyltransferase
MTKKTKSNVIDYSSADYHNKRYPELMRDYKLRLAWGHFARRVYFNDLRPGQRVLEFGGGLGANLLAIKSYAEVAMVEPSETAITIAQADGIKCFKSLFEIPNERFDYILCRHVLEHVESPLSTIKELKERLTPDGNLILVLPCESYRSMPITPELDFHLYCWNPRTASNLLSRANMIAKRIQWQFYGGKRRLLPLFETFGGDFYAKAVWSVGRVFNFRELHMVCAADPANLEDNDSHSA